jgi:transposase
MYYAGIDYHKRYSFVSIQDEAGRIVLERQITHNNPHLFQEVFREMNGPVSVVYESGLNWTWLYEMLETIPNVPSITVANPCKVRLIAEAQIKTDKIDARKLAMLLRLEVVPACHIPDRKTRDRKEVLRQRAYWVRQRTGIRNRIHKLIGKQHNLQLPQVSDIFGKRGKDALRKVVLPEPDATLLNQNLMMLEQLDRVIKQDEERIRQDGKPDRSVEILSSLPGVGLIVGSILATETDQPQRFCRPERYVAYAGLAPTTHSSGGKTYQGKMMYQCNKWLKWAYIEAAWVAIGCSTYFGTMYRHHKKRGKKANTAITIVARRMCRIAYQLLIENRQYEERSFPSTALVKG